MTKIQERIINQLKEKEYDVTQLTDYISNIGAGQFFKVHKIGKNHVLKVSRKKYSKNTTLRKYYSMVELLIGKTFIHIAETHFCSIFNDVVFILQEHLPFSNDYNFIYDDEAIIQYAVKEGLADIDVFYLMFNYMLTENKKMPMSFLKKHKMIQEGMEEDAQNYINQFWKMTREFKSIGISQALDIHQYNIRLNHNGSILKVIDF